MTHSLTVVAEVFSNTFIFAAMQKLLSFVSKNINIFQYFKIEILWSH